MTDNRPIGVFDSGVGGLTVYHALRRRLPHEDFIYFGDTARLPYGTKSAETVAQYAANVAEYLLKENIKLLVVACNTASAAALPRLQKMFPELPCLGVIEPGARQAAQGSPAGQIAVLATEGTVRSNAYQTIIKQHRPAAAVHTIAAGLMIGLAEEGWCEGAEAEAVVQKYLNELQGVLFDTLVLGCTHFPLLTNTIRKLVPSNVKIINSATATADAVNEYLEDHGLMKEDGTGTDHFLVTDGPERFQRLAKLFLPSTPTTKVELVDLSFDNSSKAVRLAV